LGGATVNPDGSNINPVALRLPNFKLPDGSVPIPTSQSIDPLKAFAQQGLLAFTKTCQFTENQVLANMDYLASQKVYSPEDFSNDSDIVTFSDNGLSPSGNVPGFQRSRYKVEALFAELKQQIKLRRVRLRRLWNVSEQFHLTATATKPKKASASPHAKAVSGSQHCVKVPIEKTVFFTQADFSTDSTDISIAGNLSVSRAQWRCLWRWADRRRRWFWMRSCANNWKT